MMNTPILKGKMTYQVLNEWQLCPKCNGSGIVYGANNYQVTAITTTAQTCDLCTGKKVISKVTGEPPSKEFRAPGMLTVDDSLNAEQRQSLTEQWKAFWSKTTE